MNGIDMGALGSVVEAQVQEALKAVTAGANGINGVNLNGVVPQDIEAEARNTLFDEGDLVVANRIPSTEAKSQEHDFRRVISYGNLTARITQQEGAVGRQNAYKTEPAQVVIKTISVTNKVTGMAEEQGTIKVLGARHSLASNRRASILALHFGRSMAMWFWDTRKTQGDRYWKGFLQQHEEALADALVYPLNPLNMPEEFCIDMRGRPLSRADARRAGRQMWTEGWGRATDLAMTPTISENFQGEVETNFAAERLPGQVGPDGGIYLGQPVKGLRLQNGLCTFYADNSLTPQYFHKEQTEDFEQGSPVAPAAPTVAVNAGAVPGSRWEAADFGAAPYVQYKIQAENDAGYGPASAASAVAATTVGDSNTVSWSSVPGALSYRILRNTKEKPNVFYEVHRVKGGSSTYQWTDLNHIIPATEQAFMYEMRNPQSPNLKGVIHKRAQDNTLCMAALNGKGTQTKPLASLGDYTAELILRREAAQLNQPRRLIRFINVGERS